MCGIAGFIKKTQNPMERIRVMTDRLIHRGPDAEAISRTEAKSSGEAAGKPASSASTPRASSWRAMRRFSARFMEKPGACSPSRRVVSKICTTPASGMAGTGGLLEESLIAREKLLPPCPALLRQVNSNRGAGGGKFAIDGEARKKEARNRIQQEIPP